MPYFRCERCALRLYSAASETRCSECSARLGKAEQLSDVIPHDQPRRNRHAIRPWAEPLPVGEESAG